MIDSLLGMNLNIPPQLNVPDVAGATYRFTVSNRPTAMGNTDAPVNLNIIGADSVVRLANLSLDTALPSESDPGQAGREVVGATFDPAARRITYMASDKDTEVPQVVMAITTAGGADYAFTLDAPTLRTQDSLALSFDQATGALSVETNDPGTNSYNVSVERLNTDGSTNRVNVNASDGNGVGVQIGVGSDWNGSSAPVQSTISTSTLPPSHHHQIYLPMIGHHS